MTKVFFSNPLLGRAVDFFPERLFFLVAALWMACPALAQSGQNPWNEPDASVRGCVYVPRAGGAVRADVVWRLPWDFPAAGGAQAAPHVAVYRASDGRRIAEVYVREFSPDRLVLAFEAPSAGNYLVYGVPYGDVSLRAYSQGVWMERFHPENYPDFSRFPKAETLGVEYRDADLADDPYALCATRTEADAYFSRAKGAFQAYFVPAQYPLNGKDRIPAVWTGANVAGKASGGALGRLFGKKNDVSLRSDTVRAVAGTKAPVQIGVVCTAGQDVELAVRRASLLDKGIVLRSVACDTVVLSPRTLGSVWLLAEVSEQTPAGVYDLSVRLEGGGTARDIPFTLRVEPRRAEDGVPLRQEEQAALLERVGCAGQDFDGRTDAADARSGVNPRFPVAVYGDYRVRSGKNVLQIDPATALPLQMSCGQTDLLADPVLLVFATANGIRKIGVRDLRFLRREGGEQTWVGSVSTHDMRVELQAGLSAYGLVRYRVEVEALSEIDFRNISLEAGFSKAVDRAYCDTLSIEEHSVFAVRPDEGFGGLWLGGDRGGVFVTVDPEEDNLFYNGKDARMTLYRGSRQGLVVGTGAFRLAAGERIVLRCGMQILPGDYSGARMRARNVLWVKGDVLPSCEQAGEADLVVVERPFSLNDPENDRRARELSGCGVDVVPYIRPFCLPADGLAARVFSSMGYAARAQDAGRTACFAWHPSIEPVFEYLYRGILEKDYVRGVALADEPYNRRRIPGYSLLRSADGTPLSVLLHEETFDASVLAFAPWIDAVVAGDTLGTTATVSADLGGAAAYLRMPAGAAGALAALAAGRNVYGVYPDTTALKGVQDVWRARRALGITGDTVRFYPWDDPQIPVRSSNPFVRLSAYALADRLVVVCCNTAVSRQQFVPEFDFEALGVKRWQVDRLERPAIDGLLDGQVLLVGDAVWLDGDGAAVLSLAWTPRTGD